MISLCYSNYSFTDNNQITYIADMANTYCFIFRSFNKQELKAKSILHRFRKHDKNEIGYVYYTTHRMVKTIHNFNLLISPKSFTTGSLAFSFRGRTSLTQVTSLIVLDVILSKIFIFSPNFSTKITVPLKIFQSSIHIWLFPAGTSLANFSCNLDKSHLN